MAGPSSQLLSIVKIRLFSADHKNYPVLFIEEK